MRSPRPPDRPGAARAGRANGPFLHRPSYKDHRLARVGRTYARADHGWWRTHDGATRRLCQLGSPGPSCTRAARPTYTRCPMSLHLSRRLPFGGLLLAFALCCAAAVPAVSQAAPCDPPVTNPIACENSLPGAPESDWKVNGNGDDDIQGFATQMSVNKGDAISFKIKSTTANYKIEIYRLGYYGGDGARLIQGNLAPTGPAAQPACQVTASTGLIDCGNWSVSRTWTVPSTAVSGVYIAHLHAQRHRRRQPDHVRRARRREHVAGRLQDQRLDLAGVQPLRRQQPVPLRDRLPARRPAGLPRGLQGLLQPAVHDRAGLAAVGVLQRQPSTR